MAGAGQLRGIEERSRYYCGGTVGVGAGEGGGGGGGGWGREDNESELEGGRRSKLHTSLMIMGGMEEWRVIGRRVGLLVGKRY